MFAFDLTSQEFLLELWAPRVPPYSYLINILQRISAPSLFPPVLFKPLSTSGEEKLHRWISLSLLTSHINGRTDQLTGTHRHGSEQQHRICDRRRQAVVDRSFTVQRETDQQHTKSRGKPWQHTATKNSTTMTGSSEAQRKKKQRASLSLSLRQRRGQRSRFLLHCNTQSKQG